MLGEIIAFLRAMWNELAKLAKWIHNPTNGHGNYVTPSNRHFLSTGKRLTVTVAYRTGKGLYTLIVGYVLGVLAHLFHVIVGIASDLWHANTSYTRWAVSGAVSAIVAVAMYGVILGKMVGRVALVVVVAIIGLYD